MPLPFLSRVIDQQSVSSNQELVYDLPNLPLCHVGISLRVNQPTANADLSLATVLGMISRVTLYARGVAIVDLTGEELFVASNLLWRGAGSFLRRSQASTSNRQYLNLIIPLSRTPYDGVTGLPALGREEVDLIIRTGTVSGSPLLSIYAASIPEMQPTACIRLIRMVQNVGATGDYDIALPTLRALLGFIFRDAASPLSADTSAMKNVRLLVNNMERVIGLINREQLFIETELIDPTFYNTNEHRHIENTASSYTQNATTLLAQMEDTLLYYTGIIFDTFAPLQNVLEFQPSDEVRLRCNATATGEVRVIPVELFPTEPLQR